ncbi:MAG: beta-phosphoglucomutase family hydrolase [Bacteroidia bacterium]|nr:beta-phosphoglucomutase family hydrolase [Bacteroidia bacterium]
MGITIHPEAKALIFDLDGTLSDSLPIHLKTWQMVGEKYGFNFDPQILYELTGRPTIEFAQRIIERYGINETPENLVKMKQETFWDHANLLKPHKPVVDLVYKYHGKIPMAVGTGAGRKSAEVQLKTLDILKYFDAVVTAEDVTRHKPEPETFIKCAELMGVNPEKCLVLEDGVLGIEAAKRAGMFIIDVRPFTY